MDSIKEMDKCIKCLYLEVSSHIADDVKETWGYVKKEIERLRKEKEWLLHEYACRTRETFDSIQYTQEQIERNMQQALKEG